MTRGAIGDGNPQGFAGIGQLREFRVLLQARQDTHAGVGDYKLEGSVRGRISDQPGLGSATVLIDVLLQLAERANQAAHKSRRQPRPDGRILGVARPLLPVAIVGRRIESSQGKDTRDIASGAAADAAGGDTLQNWLKKGGVTVTEAYAAGAARVASASSTSGPICPDRPTAIAPRLGSRPASACQRRSSATSKVAANALDPSSPNFAPAAGRTFLPQRELAT